MDNTTSMDHAEFTARRSLPMMALRGLTVFPGMMLTFEVERSMSIAALNMAMSDDQIIYLVPQKDIATDIPTPDDVYGVGTVCRIKQMMKQPGTKTIRVMAEGIERAAGRGSGPAWCRCFPPPVERSAGASLRRGRPPRCRGAVSIQFPERAFSAFPFSR